MESVPQHKVSDRLNLAWGVILIIMAMQNYNCLSRLWRRVEKYVKYNVIVYTFRHYYLCYFILYLFHVSHKRPDITLISIINFQAENCDVICSLQIVPSSDTKWHTSKHFSICSTMIFYRGIITIPLLQLLSNWPGDYQDKSPEIHARCKWSIQLQSYLHGITVI